jgi:hypothetical protein
MFRICFALIFASLLPSAAKAQEQVDVAYLITTPTVAREKPDVASKIVNKHGVNTLVLVKEAVPDWLLVEPGTVNASNKTAGWIRANKDNLVLDGLFPAILRQVKMNGKPWPASVKADITLKKIRVGFTSEQVLIALGDPLLKQSKETAQGTVEAWAFPEVVVTLDDGRVVAITKTTAK